MNPKNLYIVFNKADESEDNAKSVKAFYAEAFEQAKCKNLPKPDSLSETENILILYKKKMGKKS